MPNLTSDDPLVGLPTRASPKARFQTRDCSHLGPRSDPTRTPRHLTKPGVQVGLGRPIQKYPCGVLPAECPVAVRVMQRPLAIEASARRVRGVLGECGALFPVLHPCG